MTDYEVAIVGSGPAGVSAAVSLNDRGIRPLLIDRAAEVAASWRSRYDAPKLNTGRQFSHFPGRRYPRGTPTFPTRDQVVEYLDRHAHESGIDLRLRTDVERIDHAAGGWRLTTSTGDINARHVVVATGYQGVPFIPELPGSFSGELLHSSEYRTAEPYRGLRVLVVGTGSSGMEIAHDLTTGDVATVHLSVRTPPNIMRRAGPAGLPSDVLVIPLFHLPPRLADGIAKTVRRMIFGDLTEFGLPIPEEGPFTRARRLRVAPTLVDPEVIDAVRRRAIEVVGAVTSFDGDKAVFADGRRLAVDVVVLATGYRRGLEGSVGHLGVLTPEGAPVAAAPEPAADGLYFHGLFSRPSLIGYLGRQARPLSERIARG